MKLAPEPLEVPSTEAGEVAVKLLAANRFLVLQKLQEAMRMVRLGAVGEPSQVAEDSLWSLESAGRRALAAVAIVPRGLPETLTEELAGLCRVGGRLIQLAALLRREQVVAPRERARLRAKVVEVAGEAFGRIERLQAGSPGELEDFEACRRVLEEQAGLALEAFAIVQRWLDSEREDAAYSALGGTIGERRLARPPRVHELDITDMTHRVARKVLALSAGESFDEASEAMVREIDVLATAVVACASALDEVPLARCRNSLDALAVFTQSASGAGRSRFSSPPRPAPQS